MSKTASQRLKDCQRIISILEGVLLDNKICKGCKKQVKALHSDARCGECTRTK